MEIESVQYPLIRAKAGMSGFIKSLFNF